MIETLKKKRLLTDEYDISMNNFRNLVIIHQRCFTQKRCFLRQRLFKSKMLISIFITEKKHIF